MDELFDNVGIKIQKFAKVTFWTLLVLTGIALIFGLFYYPEEFLWFLLGCIGALGIDLLGSWLLYGFGVIVENSEFSY